MDRNEASFQRSPGPPAEGDEAQILAALEESIHALPTLQHLNRVHLPSREQVVRATELMRQVIFPGYFDSAPLSSADVPARLSQVVRELHGILFDQVRCCLRYRQNLSDEERGGKCTQCDDDARVIVLSFLRRLPAVRELLAADVNAAFEGDPAAQNTDETIFSYPGLFAISVQRLAHEFYELGVPLLPRMMTEWAHGKTGIDIHPGAQLGRGLMIDHGTGVVIGETTVIGANVKIYQGVTLGALAPAYGQLLRGQKRHPTIEDDVTIYAGATILGGETVIGRGSVVGGNLFLTRSIPSMHVVTAEPPKINLRDRRPKRDRGTDFDI